MLDSIAKERHGGLLHPLIDSTDHPKAEFGFSVSGLMTRAYCVPSMVECKGVQLHHIQGDGCFEMIIQ